MNTDYALLLSTVLSERGCVDASLQHTAETTPLVYRALAEHSYYLLYLVSVVKALLHKDDAAFAHLARAQAQRAPAAAGTLSTPAPPHHPPRTRMASPSDIPLLAPSDSLDMQLTIIGGGTCCELMLRLICGRGRAGGGGDAGIFSTSATRDPLVHPSHITVVTRQPDRLAPYAELGVHCLTRHHGRRAVAHSDVVVVACSPAHLHEVARDLFASSATETATSAAPAGKMADPTAPSPSLPPTAAAVPALRQNCVLLCCMAGVPKRKAAQWFRHSPVGLTFMPSLHTFGAHAQRSVRSCNVGNAPSLTAADSAITPRMASSLPIGILKTPEVFEGPLTEASLEEAAQCFTNAMEAHRSARIAEMHSSTSFLRPAVLEQAAASAAAEAATARAVALWRAPQLPGQRSCTAGSVPPRLTDFTAGRHPSTHPTLAEYLDLWRVLKAYVQATFAEESRKLARARGDAVGGPRQRRTCGGLVTLVLPDTALNCHCMPELGEVEAEVLPALVLLPAAQTRMLWDAWWGKYRWGGSPGTGDAAASLPPSVTDVTGKWLCRAYASVACLKASFDDNFSSLLGARTR
ncbi:hypothetical protein LSCM1_04926 [Leishmania martiniquensis]|uniref:Pyrroline-5-carboxylate reductase catalytic N-terminal domain-containing protein n=1 Tax=Leishmania martiniquensis TaxID=1580590 RepID=A0A836HL68_9TRYP|nr:hypothetical protein LSCM1_04926 [Leishmania martiniquensis]